MSRQITVTRSELSLSDLTLNNPSAGYYVSDDWSYGGVQWHHYNATSSAWAYGDRVVGQRQTAVDEVFTIYVRASSASALKSYITTIANAFGQYRYTVTINWDGDSYVFAANGAGSVSVSGNKVDPILHAAGWTALQITFPRDPGVG
jgi:hypothetical protein